MPTRNTIGFDYSLRIESTPTRILAAFFEPTALAAWWDVAAVVASPRPLGAYALQWRDSDEEDDLLGRLGGVFHGTVIDFQPGRGFFVADAYWLPPDGDPVGPMAMEVTCTPVASQPDHRSIPQATMLRVVERGLDDSPRWERYYELIGAGWPRALETMKAYLEHGRGVWDLRAYE
ncbi:MAG TPA: SRPBCC domain-containing protein [Vicinamibacterales bacterium]|jgi:uncharacterized protein YndB with AHSA1/START domain